MPSFSYTARSAAGEKVDGVLDTPDLAALADALTARGLMLVRAAPREASAGDSLTGWLKPRVGSLDVLMFCRQLATLLKAGVPLLRALKGLEESAANRRFAALLQDLQQQLASGRELSGSMKTLPLFSSYIVSMVRVGEATGRLPEVFRGLASQLQFERDIREAVRGALRYPLFVLAAAVAALMAVNLFVIPAFAKVYKGLNAELPLLTRLVMGASDFLLAWWPVTLGGTVLAAVLGVTAVQRPLGRRLWDGLLLRLPVFGGLVHRAALARFTKSFGLALGAGVPVVTALEAANETTGNVVLSERIGHIKAAAERGESLARAARATGVFTPTVLQMISVGEESGALAEMMNEVADHSQREVEHAARGLAAQIEPLLVIALGGAVLLFALGVFLPLWDLSRVAIRN